MRFWVVLAVFLVLMVGFVVWERATSHVGGYHFVCAQDGSSCIDLPN